MRRPRLSFQPPSALGSVVRAGVVGAVVLAGSSCRDGAAHGGAPPPSSSTRLSAPAASTSAPNPQPTRPTAPLNVLLITIDSLRADMPWQGYSRPIAPFLTELAQQSIVYTHAYSPSSYTAKSVAAMLTGRYPSSLYRSGYFFANYPPADEFFTETLQAKHIRTMGWHGHMYFARGKGLDQGFDVWKLVPGITFNPETDEHVTSDKMTKLGIEILGDPANTGGQFFAWAHFMDPHDQYIKHVESPDFGRKNRDRYDSEVYFTDLWLKKLVEWAEQQPWWSKTALVISADHGEAFGEHGMYKHAFELWECLVRVPLIIKLPGVAPRRIDIARSNIDLPPTIMDLMGQPPLPGFYGTSLVPELYGAAEPAPRDIVLELTEDSHNPQRNALIHGTTKLLVFDKARYELFDIVKDPGEEHDLSASDPALLADMKQRYQAAYARIPWIDPYGGNELKSGRTANGTSGPPKL